MKPKFDGIRRKSNEKAFWQQYDLSLNRHIALPKVESEHVAAPTRCEQNDNTESSMSDRVRFPTLEDESPTSLPVSDGSESDAGRRDVHSMLFLLSVVIG